MKKLFYTLSILFLFITAVSSQTIKISNNGYIIGQTPGNDMTSNPGWHMHLREGTESFARWGYLEFPLEKVSADAKKIELKIYIESSEYANNIDFDANNIHLNLFGLSYPFDNSLSWETKTEPSDKNEVRISSLKLTEKEKDSWLVFDVTDFVISQKKANASHVYFRMTGGSETDQNFILKTRQAYYGAENPLGTYYPRLIQKK